MRSKIFLAILLLTPLVVLLISTLSFQSGYSSNMWLKPLITVVIILIFLSLFSSLFFLFKDQGQGKRSVYSLGFRVSLAALLLILVSYGLYTGELGNTVPWGS